MSPVIMSHISHKNIHFTVNASNLIAMMSQFPVYILAKENASSLASEPLFV